MREISFPVIRRAIAARGALDVVAAQPPRAAQRIEGQRHRRAGADDRVDVVLLQDPPRVGQVAGDVGQVAAADEVDEVDLLALEQRAALRGVEGGPDETGRRWPSRRRCSWWSCFRWPPVEATRRVVNGRQYWSTSSARGADVARAGGAEHDRVQVRLSADPLDRLRRRDRAGGEDRHRDRPELALAQRPFVGLDAAAHAEPDLVDVRADDRVLDPYLVEDVEQHRQVHRDEAGLGSVAPADVVGEDPEGVLEAEPEQQVDDHVLEEDHRRVQPGEHLHLGVDQQRGDAFDVLGGQRRPPRMAALKKPSSGRKRLTAPSMPPSVTALAYLWA